METLLPRPLIRNGKAALAWRYALAPACIGAAALVQLSPAGSLLHPMGMFILGVVAAGWFGGAGPGVLAAVLSVLALPVAASGFFDLPSFITLGLTGAAVGWSTDSYRRAQAALREQERRVSEDRYARALQASKDGIWEWNPATDEIFMSQRARELWAVPEGVAVRTRAELKRLGGFHPDDLQATEDGIAASRTPGAQALDLEYRVVGARGEVRWVRSQGKMFFDERGAPSVMTGSLTDITERKLADLALAESEARFRSLTELSSDFYWETDAAHRYVTIELGSAYTGVRNDAAKLGRARWEIPYASPGEAAWAAHRAAIAARERFVDFRFSRIENGEERFYEHSGEPRYDAQGGFLGYLGVGRDITERKRAEEALLASEERYELAMEAAGDGHTDWNLVTDEFYISPRLLRILGYPPGTTFTGRADWVRRFPFHPEDRPRWEAAAAAHFAGREAKFRMDLRIVVNGETRWVAFTFIATRDASGNPVRWTGSIADIHDAKLAAEALRESQERYALAVAGSDDGVWDLDFAARRAFVSARARALAGMPPGPDIVPLDEFFGALPIHPEDAPRRAAAMQAHLQGAAPAYVGEFRLRQADGVYRWRRLHGLCRRDDSGKPLRMAGSISDVDGRRRAEEALRLSEARYAVALEVAEEGHWDWNVQTDEIFASAQARRVVGLPEGEYRTRGEMTALIRYYQEDGPRVAAQWRAALAGSGTEHEFEYRVLRGEEPRWIRSRWKVFRDAGGAALRVVGIVADITERKVSAEALRVSEERYALAVAGANDGIWDEDLVTGMLYRSPRNQEVALGRPSDGIDVRRRTEWAQWHHVHPDDAPKRTAAMRAHLEGRTPLYEVEYRVRHPDGAYHWIHARGVCTRDASGRALRIAGSTTNIDARKAAEEALHLSEERYALALEASEEGHFDWNVQTDEIFASAHLKKLLDLPADGSYRTRRDMVSRMAFYPGDGERVAGMAREVLAGSALQHEFEYRVLRGPARELRWLRASWKIFRGADGAAQRIIGVVSDITARKQSVDTLRESEGRFRRMTELSADTYWEQDENFRYTRTGSGTDIAGYVTDVNQGKTRWEMSGEPTPLSSSWEEHKAVLAAHQPFRDFEYRRVRPDGTMGYYSASGAPMYDAEGKFKGYQGVARDITEFRRAEEGLRASEARFRALTELSSDWYWEQDESLRFTYSSAALRQLDGHPGGSSIGKTRWELPGIVPLSSSWEEHKALIAARKPFRDFEYSRPAPDGTLCYISISGAPVFDEQGRFKGYQGIGRGINERKHIEEALRQSEERYALAVAGSNEGIFDWDLVSDRVYVSYRAQELFGLPRGELWRPRRDWRHIITFHPEDAPRLHDSIKAHIEGVTPTYDVEFRIVLPGGGVRWFRQRGVGLRDASGKAYRVVGSIGDVTEQHKAEEELRNLERQLRLAQRLEAMGTLAGGIAHDFNNILGAILGYGEMALRDARKGSRLARDLDSIVVAGERGRALVDRVLAFSRSAVGERIPVHVEKVVREALDLLSAKLPPDVTLHAKLHAGRAAMLGDATQVHQVLMNLATNAIHAMPAGGTLRVSLSAARLEARTPTLGTLQAGEYLILEVADSGTGIPPEILERIFDPFFTTKEVGTGTGLGLSLVHGIVAGLGGAIDVASRPGAGSTFTVFLPRAGDALDSSRQEEAELPRGDGQRVLVVDDEEPLVRLATRTLEDLGYAPVGFTSSAAALAAFRADPQRFDALITDERMPGMSGAALIREVRGIRDRIPVVLMTGFVGGTVVSTARAVGAEEVLKKPVLARELAASLARVLHP